MRRGQLYPLFVGAERTVQAQTVAAMARKLGSATVAHGCTAAGNDQVRFQVALRTLAPGLEILAPVRDRAFKRPEQLRYLEERGLPVPPHGAAYSTNRGLWGVTIGGRETLTSAGSIPESAWVLSSQAFENPQEPRRIAIGFEQGVPSSLDGRPLDPVALIEQLEAAAAPFGIGRGIHLGDTIIGTKGRVAFEAPAAAVLLTAHRELEKLVCPRHTRQGSRRRRLWDPLGPRQNLIPVRDIEAPVARRRRASRIVPSAAPVFGIRRGVPSAHSLMAQQWLVRRVGGRMDRGGRTRILEDAVIAGRVLDARRWRGPEPMMKSIIVDKIASVTQACGLSHEVRISTDIPCEEGIVLAVEILTDKAQYNTSTDERRHGRARARQTSWWASAIARRCSAIRNLRKSSRTATCQSSTRGGGPSIGEPEKGGHSMQCARLVLQFPYSARARLRGE